MRFTRCHANFAAQVTGSLTSPVERVAVARVPDEKSGEPRILA